MSGLGVEVQSVCELLGAQEMRPELMNHDPEVASHGFGELVGAQPLSRAYESLLEMGQTSSLPIEYQLQYGTACGNLDWSDVVRKATGDRVCGTYVGFPQKEILGVLWTNPRPFTVDSLDSLLIRLDRS